MLDHFSHSELACPTTDQVRLAAGFGEALERLRVELDAPIYLTSACRSPLHNAKVDGHPRNLHLIINGHWGTGGTCAVDVVAIDVIVKEVEAANQSNSQGSSDADVPAEEGQAKEGAWELFKG